MQNSQRVIDLFGHWVPTWPGCRQMKQRCLDESNETCSTTGNDPCVVQRRVTCEPLQTLQHSSGGDDADSLAYEAPWQAQGTTSGRGAIWAEGVGVTAAIPCTFRTLICCIIMTSKSEKWSFMLYFQSFFWYDSKYSLVLLKLIYVFLKVFYV